MLKTSICDYEKLSMVMYPFYFIFFFIKQTVCKVLNTFQCDKFLVEYVVTSKTRETCLIQMNLLTF